MIETNITEIFNNPNIVKKIQEKLPYLFQMAEADNYRDGKLGMEIGSARERILIALLISEFGEKNIKTNIPITQTEADVIVFDKPISIKTITNKKIIGVKLIWTVDVHKSLEFINHYKAECDMIFVHINWYNQGGVYFISKEAQSKILKILGKDNYFKLPKQGTNPRGVEITSDALITLTQHPLTQKIDMIWHRDDSLEYTPYQRWIDLWQK
jgi:hypothetical protein